MPEFRDKTDDKVFAVPETETEDIDAFRSKPERFEEIVPTVAPSTPERKPSILETALRSGTQGASLGFGDEAAAAINAGLEKLTGYDVSDIRNIRRSENEDVPLGELYDKRVAQIRAANEAAAKANPRTALAADVAGSMVMPGAAIKGATKLPLAARLARTAAVGGATGAIEGAGRADRPEGLVSPETAIAAAKGAAVGAIGAPVGEAALSGLTGTVKGTARVLGSKLDPDAQLMQRAQRIKEAAKDRVGLSPKEEIARSEALMKEHGDKIFRDIQYDTIEKMDNNMSGIAYSMDRVFDEANTSLKGSAAIKRLEKHVASIANPKKYQTKVFNQSSKKLESVRGVLEKIKERAKGNLTDRSTGPQVSRVDKAIETYQAKLGDVQSAPYLGLGKGGVDPSVISDTYIALDNVKRALGKAQGKIRGDKTSQQEVRDAYMMLREYLEDSKVWGKDLSAMQKDLNKSWSKYLDVSDAVESTFLVSGKKSTTKSASGWDKAQEANVARIQSILANPKNPANKAELDNLGVWLDATEEITDKLTKYYKPTPELAAEVARIKAMRKKVLEQVDNARGDYARMDKVGIDDQAKAIKNVEIARDRGIPETEDVSSILELQARREALGERSGRLARETEYASRVRSEEGELFDEDKVFKWFRGAERAPKTLVPGMAARFGSSEYIQSLGEDDNEKASKKVFDNKEDENEYYLKRSVTDRKSKPSKTTAL